jgi:hypothetical protein
VLPLTPKSVVGAIPLQDVIDRWKKLEFRARVCNYTQIDRTWDPDNPTFIVRLTDGGKDAIQISAEGETVCATVYPVIEAGDTNTEFVFRGGTVKMEYAASSMKIEWNDSTTIEKYEGE